MGPIGLHALKQGLLNGYSGNALLGQLDRDQVRIFDKPEPTPAAP